jgi:hypothetical protein
MVVPGVEETCGFPVSIRSRLASKVRALSIKTDG